MQLSTLDWSLILAFFALYIIIGLRVARQSGKSFQEFFLSGRGMPWWLLGVSMVATTFSADTPNLVTDIVRKNGVSGNWVWWAFLLTGMLTVFVYAKLWRRSGILTDLEFYELRYSGVEAAFLRGFRAIYLGVFFNIVIMATVCLAAIKIGGVMLGIDPITTVLVASVVTVLYTGLGGLRGVILTDFIQFIVAMVGVIAAAIIILQLPEIGGLSNLLEHENVAGKLNFLPDFNDPATLIPLFIIPVAVQWWAVWYPGAEPGGGGYIVQRMLSAKDESNAVGATLFFNLAHYALRPWPWLLIALASLVVFPDLDSLSEAFPNVSPDVVNDDLAFSAMLTFLPSGLLGLVVASLIAAFMSTISTHLNWGSSYIVNDFYRRFYRPEASDRELVNAGRISTVLLMAFSAIFALYLTNALQAFNILLQIGAGTGLIFILRWFWWRINAYSEIAGMVISFAVALFFEFGYTGELADHWKLLIGVAITTAGWLTVTFLTRPTDPETLVRFFNLVQPHHMGWRAVLEGKAGGAPAEGAIPVVREEGASLAREIGGMIAGVTLVWGGLVTTGFLIYGNYLNATIALAFTALGAGYLIRNWKVLRGTQA
jgi:SSS family transporter